jgi:hypothetical protein
VSLKLDAFGYWYIQLVKRYLFWGVFFVKKLINPIFYGEVGGVICRFRKSQGSGREGIAHFRQELAGLVRRVLYSAQVPKTV